MVRHEYWVGYKPTIKGETIGVSWYVAAQDRMIKNLHITNSVATLVF